jgi:hypothetical protein
VNAPTAWQYQSQVGAGALSELVPAPTPIPVDPVEAIANIGKKEVVLPSLTESPVQHAKSAWKQHYTYMAASEPVSVETIKSAPTIPLKQATKIYTPVRGTSEGARYFLVARYSDFSVAVRVKGDSLSVRIEGNLDKVPSSTINELGFSKGNLKGYWSNHVKIKNTDEGQRFLGAVLAGLGTPLTPMPDLKVISMYGK